MSCMNACPFSGVLFILAPGVVVVRGGAGKARRGVGVLTGAFALIYLFESTLENKRERERGCKFERPNGLLLMPPNASASIDRVDGSLVRFLTNMERPFESRSIHLLPESGSMGLWIEHEVVMMEEKQGWSEQIVREHCNTPSQRCLFEYTGAKYRMSSDALSPAFCSEWWVLKHN